jgi:uncharacterized damage-inducible protein DinB
LERIKKYRAKVAPSNSLNLCTVFSFFKCPARALFCSIFARSSRRSIQIRQAIFDLSHAEERDNELDIEEKSKMANDPSLPEPWLRGTLSEVPAVPRAVLHALELAKEDLQRWCGILSDAELNARPAGVAPVAFHLRHIARSIDRLLTYTEGGQLDGEQIAGLKSEMDAGATRAELFAEIEAAFARSAARIRAIDPKRLDEPRKVGRKEMPTTVGGLLVHVADHTQRHVGQAVTTAKIVKAEIASH